MRHDALRAEDCKGAIYAPDLIAGRNFKTDGMSPLNMAFELDASPSSEGAPASVTATAGLLHDFASGFRISASAIVGLTHLTRRLVFR